MRLSYKHSVLVVKLKAKYEDEKSDVPFEALHTWLLSSCQVTLIHSEQKASQYL